MKKYVAHTLLILTSFNFITAVNADVLVSRYSTAAITPLPEQINPLVAIAEFKFQPQIQTVGDAVDLILHQVGYELINEEKISNYARLTLKKPLPVTTRNLGPLKISDSLEVLMGKRVFQLVEDPINRTVNFKLKRDYAGKTGADNVLGTTKIIK